MAVYVLSGLSAVVTEMFGYNLCRNTSVDKQTGIGVSEVVDVEVWQTIPF